MSFWVYLEEDTEEGQPIAVPNFEEGGTYAVGGSTEAALNVTYNYSVHFYKHIDKDEGLRWLNGKLASEALPRLAVAANALGVKRDKDYWQATEGNAGWTLAILAGWAAMNQKARFRVS